MPDICSDIWNEIMAYLKESDRLVLLDVSQAACSAVIQQLSAADVSYAASKMDEASIHMVRRLSFRLRKKVVTISLTEAKNAIKEVFKAVQCMLLVDDWTRVRMLLQNDPGAVYRKVLFVECRKRYGFEDDQSIGFVRIITGENVFLTGPGGTGKSYVLKQAHEALMCIHDSPGEVARTAPTNVAAKQIDASTYHSFLGLRRKRVTLDYMRRLITEPRFFATWKPGESAGSDPKDDDEIEDDEHFVPVNNPFAKRRVETLKCFVLDEVSFVSEINLSIILFVLNAYIGSLDGLQFVFSGDFSQLPPVYSKGGFEWMLRKEEFVNKYIFTSMAWLDLDLKPVLLKVNRRSNNYEFNLLLQEIRLGDVKAHRHAAIVKKLVALTAKQPADYPPPFGIFPTYKERAPPQICVPQYNSLCRNELDAKGTQIFNLHSIDSFNDANYSPIQDPRPGTTMTVKCKLPDTVTVRIGEAIRCNAGDQKDIIGHITTVTDSTITVVTETGETEEIKRIAVLNCPVVHRGKPVKNVSCCRSQFPITGSFFGFTAHKAQGRTLGAVVVELSGNFESGMVYVSLSRASDPSTMHLRNVRKVAFDCDSSVRKLYKAYEALPPPFWAKEDSD